MSKLPQKHVENQWDNSWDMLEAKKYKVLNISMVTLLGESQADHEEGNLNGLPSFLHINHLQEKQLIIKTLRR